MSAKQAGVRNKDESSQETVDLNVVKALGHPLRQRILQVLNEKVASPSEIARELEEPLSNVSYHVKILVKCEALELVRTQPVRGALEHFYRTSMSTMLDEKNWRRIPQATRDLIFDQTLQQVWDHAAEAAGEGGFKDPRMTVAWVRLQLDDQALAALNEGVEKLVNLAGQLTAESLARASESNDESADDGLKQTELALLHFERS